MTKKDILNQALESSEIPQEFTQKSLIKPAAQNFYEVPMIAIYIHSNEIHNVAALIVY